MSIKEKVKPIKELFVGMRVEKLIILEIIPGSYPKGQKHITGGHKNKTVRCLCDCGIESIKYYDSIRWHKTKSCGCLSKVIGQTHGMHKSTEYGSWDGMKRRCYNKNTTDYIHYGARGITMCERWKNSFESFIEDVGLKPTPSHTLDRIDNNGDYTPSNTRWATRKEQANNRRGFRITKKDAIEIRRLKAVKTPKELAEMFIISRSSIYGIINNHTWMDA